MFACFCLLFLFFIERRFYGESTPFGKKSHRAAEIFGYLNSQQALADYAILIRSLKQNLSSEASPVVVFGGSYGGILGACSVVQAQLELSNSFNVIKRSWEELDAVSNMKACQKCAPCGSQGSYERRSGVAERAEEARGGHYRKVDHSSFWEGFSRSILPKFAKLEKKSDCNLRLMIYYRLEEETHRPFSCCFTYLEAYSA
ncbi:unnamed protein product [Brassica oleracea]